MGMRRTARNLRWVFFVFGLIIVLCSLAALTYAFGPVEILQEQFPLAPTFFAPP